MSEDRVRGTQEFFGTRAAGWDERFPDDGPAYAAAVEHAAFPSSSVVADVGCGTGRALPYLRDAIGRDGVLVAVDVTDEMLRVARPKADATGAQLMKADALRLPLLEGSLGGVFAAGLVSHLADPAAGLAELARVTLPGGRLVLFHPIGRAALAARHGRTLSPDDTLAPGPLEAALVAAGWRISEHEDGDDRFLVLAERVPTPA